MIFFARIQLQLPRDGKIALAPGTIHIAGLEKYRCSHIEKQKVLFVYNYAFSVLNAFLFDFVHSILSFFHRVFISLNMLDSL